MSMEPFTGPFNNKSRSNTAMKLEKILFVTPYEGNDPPESMPFAKLLMTAMESKGIGICNVPVSKKKWFFQFFEQIKRFQAQLISCNAQVTVANFGTLSGLLVAFFGQKPKVIIFRGSDLNYQPSENMIYQIVQHLASHVASFFVDGVVCVSKELQNRLLTNKPCLIAPSPTNLDFFRPMDREQCRRQLGWGSSKPVAIFFGQGGRKCKRSDMAKKIADRFRLTNSNVELKIISDMVPLDIMPIYLNAADCLVFLSDSEGSPNLIRDACACNLPIVTVPVGDVAEVLENVIPSKIVDRETEMLTREIINVSSLRTRSNGRTHVMKFSKEIIAMKHMEFYKELLRCTQNYVLKDKSQE